MLDAALQAFAILAEPSRMIWLLTGVSVGLVIGFLPGMGGTVGMSILLPFVYGMDQASGLAMLIGMYAVIATSDTFTSVLIGVPGSGGAQATIMDGYPMAKQGKATIALGAAFLVSGIGGVIGAVALFSILGIARPIILSFGSPELLMLTLLGLSMVATLVRGSAIRGLSAAALGLLIGTIGVAPTVAYYRYTGDQPYLFDGISLPVLALGLFAVPEIVDLASRNKTVSASAKLSGSVWEGARVALKHKWLILRSSLIGMGVGMTPGLGSTVSSWITYGSAQATCKKSDTFGKGDIRGVIAPESANNATEGGALMPTLLFGIPGGAATAILLGGMILLGVEPGPSMLKNELPLTLTIVWTLVIANILATVVCSIAAGQVAKLTLLPSRHLFPFFIVVFVFAAYLSSQNWGDILTLAAIGILGVVLKALKWPRSPLLVGFVLEDVAERYLHLSVARYGWDWLGFPIVIGIGVVIAAFLVLVAASSVRRSRKREVATSES